MTDTTPLERHIAEHMCRDVDNPASSEDPFGAAKAAIFALSMADDAMLAEAGLFRSQVWEYAEKVTVPSEFTDAGFGAVGYRSLMCPDEATHRRALGPWIPVGPEPTLADFHAAAERALPADIREAIRRESEKPSILASMTDETVAPGTEFPIVRGHASPGGDDE